MPYKDREKQLAFQRADAKRRRDKRRQMMIDEFKADGCVVCGETEPVVLGFHHRDQAEKLFTIGQGYTRSIEKLRAEAEKCVVLCFNCHMKHHYGLVEIPA